MVSSGYDRSRGGLEKSNETCIVTVCPERTPPAPMSVLLGGCKAADSLLASLCGRGDQGPPASLDPLRTIHREEIPLRHRVLADNRP